MILAAVLDEDLERVIDGRHHSTSLAMIELTAKGKAAGMIFTEFVAWHDGTSRDDDRASREKGTRWQFDNAAEVLKQT